MADREPDNKAENTKKLFGGRDAVWLVICLIMVIAFLMGILFWNSSSAGTVLSVASTVVSIALSLIAILYTMIESVNSSRINENTISMLNQIDSHVENANEALMQSQKKLDLVSQKGEKVRKAVERLEELANRMETTEEGKNVISIDSTFKKELDGLLEFINEDIDE